MSFNRVSRAASAAALVVGLSAGLVAGSATAGEKPVIAPVPGWVVVAPDVLGAASPQSGNFLPLFDEQVLFYGDTVTTYIDAAYAIPSAEVLAQRGTLSLNWQPAHGDLIIHKIEILRGTQRIDALAGNPDFTILRREAGLERSIQDGSLTAVKHIEGLRVGDTLHTTFSLSERDAVLKGNAQAAVVLLPKPVQIGFGRARLIWPQNLELNLKAFVPGVDLTPKPLAGGRKELTFALPIAILPEMPGALPTRYQPAPVILGSTFKSWSDVASVMAPLYTTAGAIPDGSDLAKVTDAIAARSTDPLQRMAEALQTVQDDVRYQLMAMGTGNYVPQTPADTWQKRYGDCKAKTLLLLAMLNRMGITAEPVLANITRGSTVPLIPPSAMAFDHVLVRAEVKGESFWLDGTLLGSRLADLRDVPRFGSVLPLRAAGSTLLTLPTVPHNRFDADVDLAMDNSAGPHLPTPFTLKIRFSGLTAAQVRVKDDATSLDQLKTFAENISKSWTGSTTVGTPSAAYDAKDATWTFTVDGAAYPDWTFVDGHYELALKPTVKTEFDPDRSRSTWRQLPAILDNPVSVHSRLTLKLPDGGKGVEVEGTAPLQVSLPLVDWRRTVNFTGPSLVEEITSRQNGAEIAAADIGAAKKTIADTMSSETRVRLPSAYQQRWDDIAARRASASFARTKAVFDSRIKAKPDDAGRIDDRGWLFERLFDWKSAEADYSASIAQDATPDRYIRRARVRSTTGDHANALKDAQAAFDIDSSNAEARNLLAVELAIAGKVDEAVELTEAKPDLSTDEGQGQALSKVEVLERGGRHDDALAILQAALTKRPSAASLLNARCWFQALRNVALDQALKDCNRAIELASDPAAYLDSRAMVHYRAGRFDEALTDLTGALAIAPEMAPTHFMRGIVLSRQGKVDQAARELAIARRLYPDIDNYLANYGIKAG